MKFIAYTIIVYNHTNNPSSVMLLLLVGEFHYNYSDVEPPYCMSHE